MYRSFSKACDGDEAVFAVMDGTLEMHYREDGMERIVTQHADDSFYRRNPVSIVKKVGFRGASGF